MASTFSKVFSTLNSRVTTTNRHLPMLNEIYSNLSSYYTNAGQTQKKKALMNWYKSIPELTALANKVARDITAKYHFEPVLGSGRNKIKKAEDFALKVGYRRTKFSQVIDRLILGESYGWKKTLTEEKIMKEAESFVKNINLELKEKKALAHFIASKAKFEDEDLLIPRDYRYIASSTMENVFDKYDIKEYVQHVGGDKPEVFITDEIIRSTFMDIDGRVAGFTPVESMIVQLELLRLMWQNMMSIQKNGGTPDKIFAFKNLSSASPAYKQIKESLEKYKLVENRHGNMLLTSDVNVIDIQNMDKMPFQDVGLYVTSVAAMQWQVPRSSIPFIQGGTNTKDDTGGNSEKGYWDNIEYMQAIDAEIDNTQLWIPHFGVKLVYDTIYVQKDIQEQQAKMSKLNNLKLEDDLLSLVGLKVSKDKRLHIMGYFNDEVEERDGTEPDINSTLNNQLSNTETSTTIGEQNRRDKKRDEQIGSQNSRGTPNGFGKEKEYVSEKKESKQLLDTPAEKLDLKTFIDIYKEDKQYVQGPGPRVFMRQNELFTTLKFKSTDFVYFTVLSNDEISDNKVLLSNLGKLYMI